MNRNAVSPPQAATTSERPDISAAPRRNSGWRRSYAQALRHALLQPAGLAQRRHDDHVVGQRPAGRHSQQVDQGVREPVETGFETDMERHGLRRTFEEGRPMMIRRGLRA